MPTRRVRGITLLLAATLLWPATDPVRGQDVPQLPENPYASDPDRACGPLCLSFLDRYYRGENRYETVLKLCPPSNLGTNLEQVRHTAKTLGYQTSAFKDASLGQLKRLKYPAIVHLRNESGTGHYIVLLKWDRNAGVFRGFDPPAHYGDIDPGTIARYVTGLGLVVADSKLPRLSELLDDRVEPIQWAATGLLAASCVALFVYDRRRKGDVRWHTPSRKASVALLVGLSLVASSIACSRDESERSAATAEGRFVNLGTVRAGTVLKHRFEIVNTSDKPFKITKIDKSCSCQAVAADVDRDVPPGGSTTVSVEVPTKGVDGPLAQHVLVSTSSADPDFMSIQLTLQARAEARFRPIPSQIMLGKVAPRKSATAPLQVRINDHLLAERFRAAEVIGNPFVTIERREQSPGELSFLVAINEQAPVGAISGQVRLRFDDPEYAVIDVPITGQKLGTMKALPQVLLVDRSAVPPGTQRLRVFSTDQSPFRVTRVQSPEGVAVTWEQSADLAPSVDLQVKVGEEAKPGDFALVIHAAGEKQPAEIHVPLAIRAAQSRN